MNTMAKQAKKIPQADNIPQQIPADMPIELTLTAGDVQNIMLALDEIPHRVAKGIEPKLQDAILKAIAPVPEDGEAKDAV